MTAIDRNRLMRRLHVMKREQGLDDDLYRDKLEGLTGKRSAAELSDAELEETVAAFRRGQRAGMAAKLPDTKQARMIQAQWISLWNLGVVHDKTDGAITAFVKRQTGLDAARWLTSPQDVAKVAEALKDWMAREGVDWSNLPGSPPFMRLPAFRVACAQWRKLTERGSVTANRTWTGRQRSAVEEVIAFAQSIAAKGDYGPCQEWTNSQWARVNRSLAAMLRARPKTKKEKAA